MFKKSKLFSLLALFSLLLLAFPVLVFGAEAQTKQFNFTGGQQSWTVPSGVSSIKIEAYGASGGNDGNSGGNGGYASGNLTVTAGQTLYFYVGGQGIGCVSGSGGGFNGGGNAGYSGCSGGGGGASDVRVGGIQLSNRVIVAGGGGGAGLYSGGTAGGGTTNLVVLGQGGNHPSDGGGGGGGYYGGSYGSTYYSGYGWYASDTGGYGGSSYTSGVTNGTQTSGIWNGFGVININWSVSDTTPPTGTIVYSTATATNQNVIATLSTSEPVTITNNGGSSTYTFENNGSFTFEFKDAAGNTGSALASVSNIDKVAPTLSISVDNAVLKTPNHKLIPIVVTVNGNDANGSGVKSIILTSITNTESDNALGDGNTTEDIQGAEFGTSDTSFLLRAERSGNDTGRVYTITYTITDLAGNTNSASTTVTVPKSGK
jgi:hypothetical protein